MSETSVEVMRGRRVLVVDDEEGMRHMLSMLLARHGVAVAEAENGEQAYERLRSSTYDVALCDMRMPTLDGMGFLRKVREAKIPLPVIMMTAHTDLDTAVEALKTGATDYVSKPFRGDEVLLKLRMAFERQRLEEERERLRHENEQLRGDREQAHVVDGLVGKSRRLVEILQVIRKVADYKSTVLLLGESGTGKELLARAVHQASSRKGMPFIAINCGAIPENLLESELFGYAKGAFTDASQNKVGIIEEASGGTLFLDEIGELPLALQVKLLRFLQEEEIRRVGDTKSIKVDVRVVAATARDLQEMVREGTFREDLYYRLNVLQLQVPALRDRRDDIPLLVDYFLHKHGARLGRPRMTFSKEALRVLVEYPWPGNIRELENTVERCMVLADQDHMGMAELPERFREEHGASNSSWLGDDLSIKKAVRAIERELIRRSLEKTGGNRTRAAELLEISHRALLYKIKEYKLR